MNSKYADMLEREHPISKRHPRMSLEHRAAIFSPFAALTGYEAVLQETARVTEADKVLTTDERERLDHILEELMREIEGQPVMEVCCFQKDAQKEGGVFLSYEGILKKVDREERLLLFEDGMKIAIDTIREIKRKKRNLF